MLLDPNNYRPGIPEVHPPYSGIETFS